MSPHTKVVKVVISTVFQDAGDATRAIEIAKGIRSYTPPGFEARITFISRGSRFEQAVTNCGFDVYHATPRSAGIGERHDYKMSENNFIGDRQLAKELIDGELLAYHELIPDVVIFGFWPIAGLSYRMVKRKIVGICFLPIPLNSESLLDIIPDIPEDVPLVSALPLPVRHRLLKHFPRSILKRFPPLRQSNILWAAKKAGWGAPIVNLFDMLRADLTIVNDIPDFYDDVCFNEKVEFSGPLFSRAGHDKMLDSCILDFLGQERHRLIIFCTLGSSGLREHLIEMVRALSFGVGLQWDAIVLSPPSVCPIEEARSILANRPGVYVTDKFVPAEIVNSLVDIVICHGGQGTIQTAMHSGTPLVGVPTQTEQFLNLHNVESSGAGIHIPRKEWTAKNIQEAVVKLASDPSYFRAAERLRNRMGQFDGQKISADHIWRTIITECRDPLAQRA
jgi:UDP:flavonoid glycosyltransferase YjiC (YdhE family)